jgi:hypothetical protein
MLFISCTSSKKNGDNLKRQSMVQNDSLIKTQVFNALVTIDKAYNQLGNQVFFTESMGYERFVNENGNIKSEIISDSSRISLINKAPKSLKKQKIITNNFYKKIVSFNESLEDPVNLGYLMLQSDVGKSMTNILTKRGKLNLCYDYIQDDDISDNMSDRDYIAYHMKRIHLIGDSLAYYKNIESELCISEKKTIVYFKLKKVINQDKFNWILDNIVTCIPEKEEEQDLYFLGESKPIAYYEAKEYDYGE